MVWDIQGVLVTRISIPMVVLLSHVNPVRSSGTMLMFYVVLVCGRNSGDSIVRAGIALMNSWNVNSE